MITWKTKLSAIILSLLIAPSAGAVKARPGVVRTYTQPDGTAIEVMLAGDERFHYFVSPDGTPLLPDSEGRLVAVDESRLMAQYQAKAAVPRSRAAATAVAAQGASWEGVGLFGEQFPASGERNALIILVEYSDIKFSVTDPHDYFTRFLNQPGFSDHGGKGSARDFFLESSSGRFSPTFDVYGPVTIGKRADYGANDRYGDDKNAHGMVIEACRALDSEIDFTAYDTDGDGEVDNVYVIYAGQGEASYGPANSVWPHQWSLDAAGASLVLDGVKINNYGCCNEWENGEPDGIGTFCHEFGHVLGLPDLYSYSSSRNNAKATPGIWDIMDEGCYNGNSRSPCSYSAYERNALGWIDLIEIKDGMDVVIPDLRESNTAYIVPVEGVPNEFFLFENRQQAGRDVYLPGHGMLVWHINFNRTVWEENSVNDVASRQYVDIEEANRNADNYSLQTMAGYPFPGTTGANMFSDTTQPNMISWGNKKSGLVIHGITEADGNISFKVSSTSGISDAAEDNILPGELCNLQGVTVRGIPAPGIYLRRTGGKVEKVVVK